LICTVCTRQKVEAIQALQLKMDEKMDQLIKLGTHQDDSGGLAPFLPEE